MCDFVVPVMNLQFSRSGKIFYCALTKLEQKLQNFCPFILVTKRGGSKEKG